MSSAIWSLTCSCRNKWPPVGVSGGVDLAGHDRLATRRTLGLEAALVDHDRMAVHALEIADSRSTTVKVAGPAGLLVAKIQKISERAATARPDRLRDKDAADVYRMFQVIDASDPVDLPAFHLSRDPLGIPICQ